MATVNEKLTAIADEVRALSGTSDALGLDAMATNIESANAEVGNQTDLLAQVTAALENKGTIGYNTGYRDATNKYRPSFLETGKLIKVEVVEGYPIKASTAIERSDAGYDSITIGYFGKNLFDYTQTTFTNEYVAVGTGNIAESSGYSCTGFIPCSHLVGQTITLNHPPIETGGGNPGMGFYSDTFEGWDGSGVWLGHGGAANGYTATVPEGAKYFRFSVPRTYADGTQIQIELGDTVTDYEAFKGKTVPNSLSEPVYGGVYDWDTGVLESPYACVKLADLEWEFHSDNDTYSAILPNHLIPDLNHRDEMSCTNTLVLSLSDTLEDICSGNISYESNIFNVDYVSFDNTYQIAVYIEEAANSSDDLQSVLTANNPLLIYRVTEPKRTYLKPCQVIALDGKSFLYCSVGNTTASNRVNLEDDYDNIFSAAYDSGQQAESRRIWSDFQDGGARTNYQNAFYSMGKNAFKPVYDITVKQCTTMFQHASIEGSLTDILNEYGVKLIWRSDATGNTAFYGSDFTQIPPVIAPATLGYFFAYCDKLETIDSIDVSRIPASSTTAFNYAFAGCTSLKNLTIIGEIKPSGLNVSDCPLTHDSLMSIINALETKTSGTFTVTLGADNLAKLTDAEKAIATNRGWTLA